MPPVKIYHPEEKVDIVDQNDQVIAQILKVEAHEKGSLHRCVIGQVVDSRGRRLFVKQSATRQDVGQFVLPIGGHVQAGETLQEALAREAEEELGFENNFKSELVGKFIYNRDILGRHENHYFNIFLVFSDQKPKINHESDEFKYFSPSQLKKILKKQPELFGAPALLIYKKFFPEFFS